MLLLPTSEADQQERLLLYNMNENRRYAIPMSFNIKIILWKFNCTERFVKYICYATFCEVENVGYANCSLPQKLANFLCLLF